MPSEEATRHKNEGASAYSKGDFTAAVAQFSAAIEKTSNSSAEDKEFLKLLHSNRSAAYQNLKQYEKALEDGSRCIELDSQWPKGYGRKGDALLALKRFGEAYNAYNAGLRITPADQSLAQKAEQAMSGIRNEAQQSYTQTNNSSSSGSPYVHYLHLAIIGTFVVYCIPFIPWSAVFGRICAGSFAAEQVLGLLQRHGRPRFENDYAVRVLPDPAMPYLLLGVFVAMSPRIYFMSLVPILLFTAIHFLSQILQYVRAHARDVIPRMLPLVQRFAPAMVPMVQNLQVDALFSDRNIPQLQLVLRKMAAQAQVSQGVFLIVELLLPTRNIIQMYLWWQFLKLQYMQEQSQPSTPNNRLIQDAFKSLDQQLTGVLSYRMVPQMVRTGYGYVKTYLAKQVEPPRTGAAAGANASAASGGLTGMLSRCNIM